MIQLSIIDDKLTIYKNNKVILFGAGKTGNLVYKRLKVLGITVYAFCDNAQEKWNTNIDGIDVVQPEELFSVMEKSYIVQIASIYNDEIEMQLKSYGITNYISYWEFEQRLYDLSKYRVLKNERWRKFYIHDAHLFDVMKTNNEWPM